MPWSWSNIDWSDTVTAACAIGALALSLKQEVDGQVRKRREDRNVKARAVRLRVELDRGRLVAEISYDSGEEHTVYVARVTALAPATAELSLAHLMDRDLPRPKISFDPAAPRTRALEVELERGNATAAFAAFGVSGLLGGAATVRIEIIDEADRTVLLDFQRKLKA